MYHHLKNRKTKIHDRKGGYAFLASVVIISALLSAALVAAYGELARTEDALVREQSRLEAETTARACISRAALRYMNGLRIFPHDFFLEEGTCTLQSATESGDVVSMVLIGKSLGQSVSLTASFSKSSLKIVSYSF